MAMHRVLWLCSFALWLLATDAFANAARPWDPGEPLIEPVARIGSTEIVRETLHIDARNFASGGHASIRATYRLLCSEEGVFLPLVFVSPGIDKGTVLLDGKALPMEVQGADGLPASWQSPSTTPDAIREGLQFTAPIERVLAFTAPLKRGEHELSVSYEVRPTIHHGSTLVAMQLAYVLSPARDWRAFGGLDVEVLAPEGWTLQSTPALTRAGSRWHGGFDGLPADALSMTFRPPEPTLRALIPWFAFCLALLACVVGGRKAGEALGERFNGCAPSLVGLFVLGTLGAMLVMGAWFLGREVMSMTLPSALTSRDVDYDALGVAALGLMLGFVITVGTAAYGRSQAVVRTW